MYRYIIVSVLASIIGALALSIIFIVIEAGFTNHLLLLHMLILIISLLLFKHFSKISVYRKKTFGLGILISLFYFYANNFGNHYVYESNYYRQKDNLIILSNLLKADLVSQNCAAGALKTTKIHSDLKRDYYGDGNIKILKKGNICILYSVGIDKVDDGGRAFMKGDLFYHKDSMLWNSLTTSRRIYSEAFLLDKLSGDIVIVLGDIQD